MLTPKQRSLLRPVFRNVTKARAPQDWVLFRIPVDGGYASRSFPPLFLCVRKFTMQRLLSHKWCEKKRVHLKKRIKVVSDTYLQFEVKGIKNIVALFCLFSFERDGLFAKFKIEISKLKAV